MTDLASIIEQLEQQRTAIDNALEVLRGLPRASQPAAKGPAKPKKSKRDISGEGRQRQIEAMRQYWAKKKRGGKKTISKKVTKKGGLTAAGRKALSENMKKLWAEKRLGGNR